MIAFELLTGSRPFPGPRLEDFREQHLHAEPPSLTGVPSSLAALVEECLYKAPGARSTPSNLAQRLSKVGAEEVSGGLARPERRIVQRSPGKGSGRAESRCPGLPRRAVPS